MQARNCRERILALKQWRMDNGKTIEQCIEMCGDFPSDTTITRIFTKGGEDKTFRESTIAAIELALLGKVYSPEIKIPVEDVVRAQEDTAKRFADENRMLHQTVRRQAVIIRTLVRLGIVCIAFFSGVALYDFFNHSAGFWNTDSSGVWIAKVAFLVVVAVVLVERVVALRKLKAQFEAEEAQIAEAKV